MKNIGILIPVMLIPPLLHAQYEWDIIWQRTYGNPPYFGVDMRVVGRPDIYTDFCGTYGLCADNEVAIDGNGYILTVASWGGGSANQISGIRVFRLNPSSGSIVWFRDLNQTWDQVASDVRVDRSGNYVVLYRVDVGNYPHCWGGKIYRLRSSDGTTLCENTGYFWSGDADNCWHNYWDGPYGMDIDDANHAVVVTGDAGGFYMWKFDQSCQVLWWIPIHTPPYPASSAGRDVVVDRAGNYVAVGYETQTASMVVAKVSPSGTILWKRFYPLSGEGGRIVDEADAEIAVDSSNNYVIVTYDGKVIKLDSNGNILWSRYMGNVRLDAVVVPSSEPTYLIAGTLFESGDRDVYVAKIRASDGSVVWSQTFDRISSPSDNTGGDMGTGIALDPLDETIVVSGYSGNANFAGYEWVFKLAGLTPVQREESIPDRETGRYRVFSPDGRLIMEGRYAPENLPSGGLYIIDGPEGRKIITIR